MSKRYEQTEESISVDLEEAVDRICTRLSIAVHKIAISGLDIIDIQGAAALLHCSVDTVRRIPTDELPVYRVGKSNLYLKDEILAFVRSKRVRQLPTHNNDQSHLFVDELLDDMLQSDPVDVREPSTRKVL